MNMTELSEPCFKKKGERTVKKNNPKIVILDSYAANPGDLSWDGLKELGNVTIYDRCPGEKEEILRRCRDAEIVLTNKVPFPREILTALPELKLIAVQATGYNIIDCAAARESGITVCNVPSYSTDSVAQLVFAMILELSVGSAFQSREVHEGKWSHAKDFTFFSCPMTELAGQTLGIFGLGTIGRKVAQIGHAFGMKVLYYSRSRKECDFAAAVTLEELFAQSDILTLHAPQTPETMHIVNAENLRKMKSNALLINTARGGLVDSPALAEALNRGIIAGAGIDVLEQEPPPEDHVLLHARNCLVTPHVGWATLQARKRLIRVLCDNVRAFLAGSPVNVVN